MYHKRIVLQAQYLSQIFADANADGKLMTSWIWIWIPADADAKADAERDAKADANAKEYPYAWLWELKHLYNP